MQIYNNAFTYKINFVNIQSQLCQHGRKLRILENDVYLQDNYGFFQ